MKKLLSFAVICALCGFAVACGGDNGNEGDDIQIVADNGNGDTVEQDNVANPDADRDTNNNDGTIGTDENTVKDDSVATDGNVATDDSVATDDNPGVDTNEPPCASDLPGSCKYYWTCYGECPQQGTTEGDACIAECQGQLTTEGQSDLAAFNQCLYTTCGSATTEEAWYACVNENCTEAIIGCYWGCDYDTCAEMYGCYDGCPEDDTSTTDNETQLCYGECRDGASKAAQLDQNAMYECAYTECPICETYSTAAEEETCNTCFNEAIMGNCWDQYKKCMESGTKYMTCVDFTICFTTCQYTAETQAAYDACVDECQTGVDADALRNRIIAENCSMDACPDCAIENPNADQTEACNTCWAESMYGTDAGVGACNDEWSVCAGTDNTTCMDYYDCVNTCQDYGCVASCRGNTTLAGMKEVMAASDCSSTACPDCAIANPTAAQKEACDTCWAASQSGDCAEEWNICIAHGDKGCNDTLTAVMACADQACVQTAYAAATIAAQNLYNSLVDCWGTACPKFDQACLETASNAGGACATDYSACTGN